MCGLRWKRFEAIIPGTPYLSVSILTIVPGRHNGHPIRDGELSLTLDSLVPIMLVTAFIQGDQKVLPTNILKFYYKIIFY